MSDRLAMAERLAEARELEQLRSEVKALRLRADRAEAEAAMWREQIYTRMALNAQAPMGAAQLQALAAQSMGAVRSYYNVSPLGGAFGAAWR